MKNIEIIYIDDFSTDGTPELIEEYQKNDPRIILIKHSKNKGTLISRIDGIKNSHGEYLTFVDGDDILLKDILSKTYDLAITSNIDIVLFKGYKGTDINDKKIISERKNFKKKISQPFLGFYMYYGTETGNGQNILRQIDHNIWGKLFKKEIVDNSIKNIDKFFLNQHMIFYDDCLLLFLFYRTAWTMTYLDYPGYFNFIIKNSRMAKIWRGEMCQKTTRDCFMYLKFLIENTFDLQFEKDIAIYQFKYMNQVYGACYQFIQNDFQFYYEIIDEFLECKKINEEDKDYVRKVLKNIKDKEKNVLNRKKKLL